MFVGFMVYSKLQEWGNILHTNFEVFDDKYATF